MNEATILLNAEAASIFLVDAVNNELFMKVSTNLTDDEAKEMRVPFGKGLVGYAAKTGELLNTKNTEKDDRFYPGIDKRTGMKTVSCLTVPLKIEEQIIGAAQIINKKGKTFFDEEDELLLTEFSKLASITLDKALMHEQIVLKEKMETDLAIASSIQNNLLPENKLVVKDYMFTGFYKPAKYVSGDYFDFFPIAENEVFFTIGDVTGKGAHASLLMASVEAFLSASFEYKHNLTEVVFKLNNFFTRKTPEGIFVTMFFGILNTDAMELTYINAGHPSPFIIRKNGNKVVLEATDVVLGVMQNWKYEVNFVSFEPEDLLFSFTDGIIEARNLAGDLFGFERLFNEVKKYQFDSNHILTSLPKAISDYTHPQVQGDDISFLLISGANKNK